MPLRLSSETTPLCTAGRLLTDSKFPLQICETRTQTGAVVYEERLRPHPGRLYASGVMADGKIYYISREKGAYVVAAAPRYKLLAHNTIASDDSVFNATPAISRGKLLIRSRKYLYCIGEKR